MRLSCWPFSLALRVSSISSANALAMLNHFALDHGAGCWTSILGLISAHAFLLLDPPDSPKVNQLFAFFTFSYSLPFAFAFFAFSYSLPFAFACLCLLPYPPRRPS